MSYDEQIYFRKVIRITAEDSPNVKRGLAQIARGEIPDGKQVVAGVLSWEEFCHRMATWDEQRKTVGLYGRFYEGKEVQLFPETYLLNSIAAAAKLDPYRRATGIGIDTAEGGDKTALCAGDSKGILELISRKTPNTDSIIGEVIAFGVKWGVPPKHWLFDSGGGGKQHADRLRGMGFPVETIPFGGRPTLEMKHAMHLLPERIDVKEDQYVYVNNRAEMYHQLALAVEGDKDGVFAIPCNTEALIELHRQLSLIPKIMGDWQMWDAEGRIRMLPKQKSANKLSDDGTKQTNITLTDIIGHSPDELDSAVLQYRASTNKKYRAKVRVA